MAVDGICIALQYVRAFLVLKECMRLQPDDVVVYLQAAKLCYEHLDMVRDFSLTWNTWCNVSHWDECLSVGNDRVLAMI